MLTPQVQADAGLDTESVLRMLAPELDRPAALRRARRQRRMALRLPELDRPAAPRPARRRRRTALRIVVLAAAVAAAVFVLANVTPTRNGSAVPLAQAQAILRHVRAALVFPPHAIYEETRIATVTARDGARFTSEDHEWQSTSFPYDNRLIRSWNGKVQSEQAFINGHLDLYDPRTNTVYRGRGGEARQIVDTALAAGPRFPQAAEPDDQPQRRARRQECDRADLRQRSLQLLDLAGHVSAAAVRRPPGQAA